MERGVDYVIGNMAWNGVLFVALGVMVRKWMGSIEKKIDGHCKDNREDHKGFREKIDNHETRISKCEVHVEASK